jgi:hypothetical protein
MLVAWRGPRLRGAVEGRQAGVVGLQGSGRAGPCGGVCNARRCPAPVPRHRDVPLSSSSSHSSFRSSHSSMSSSVISSSSSAILGVGSAQCACGKAAGTSCLLPTTCRIAHAHPPSRRPGPPLHPLPLILHPRPLVPRLRRLAGRHCRYPSSAVATHRAGCSLFFASGHRYRPSSAARGYFRTIRYPRADMFISGLGALERRGTREAPCLRPCPGCALDLPEQWQNSCVRWNPASDAARSCREQQTTRRRI